MERRFIESVRFPFREVSEASTIEKGPGRPPYWRMVFWWTRKPLISARAVIAGCLLPENTNPTNFLRSIGVVVRKRKPDGRPVFQKNPHRVKPRLRFDGVKILDPFACFGSIPLEGLRLGLSTTACDLLPVGYVFLKAVLEYPARYGRRLVEDVKKWGEWITERLGEDLLIKELYDEDVAVYIGSWEVRCPSCGKWTPIVGNWWLAREKRGRGYKKLAWMEPKIEGDEVKIHIVDLNKTLGKAAVEKAKVERLKVTVDGKESRVPESNMEARRERATCLHCGQPIMKIDPATGRHYTETRDLPNDVKDKLEGYIKYTIKLRNQSINQVEAYTKPNRINGLPARLKLLVKVKTKLGDLEFEPCTESDQEKLKRARQEMEKLLEEGDPDIPREGISLYSVRYLFPILYGMTEWYKLFNPRQLLTLVKLTKLIRKAGKLIEEESVKKGKASHKEAFEYAEAVTTYLAIALARYVDYNSLCTVWNYGGQLPAQVAHTLSMRGIAMMWNWGDVSPFANMSGTGSWYKNLDSAIPRGLQYLTNVYREGHDISTILDDATILGKLNPNEKFDLVITDPPYYDDVPYCELSDFYYVWLKRALSDIGGDNRLTPKFTQDAFFERIDDEWVEISTQWEKYALSEVSLNPPRLGPDAKLEDGVKHFQRLLNSSFATMASKLKKDGSLVTYYAHTDPNAWKALLEAGWAAAGLRVTNAFPIATESAQSVVSRGKLSMDTSIIVAWGKGSEGSIKASSLYDEMVEGASKRAKDLIDLGAIGRDLVIGTLAAALAVATRYKEVRVMGRVNVGTLVDQYVYPAAYLGMAKAYAQKAEIRDGVKSPDAMFYLLVKSTLAGAKEKILESTDARIFSIGTSLNLKLALKQKILRPRKKEGGSQVAKAKTLALVEPTSTDRSKLAELLEARDIGTKEPEIECTVDALHVLEYFAVTYSREEFRRRLGEMRAKYPAFVEEALSMARILAKVLPERDVEKTLCTRILEHLRPITPKLA